MKRTNPKFMHFSINKIISALTISLLLTGCNSTPQKPIELTPAQIKFSTGTSHYQNGEFGLAEKNLLDSSIWNSPNDVQVESLKYLAFIYCVTERVSLCRHSFYMALQLDPGFELSPAESTHPLWGPEFILAQSGLNGIQ